MDISTQLKITKINAIKCEKEKASSSKHAFKAQEIRNLTGETGADIEELVDEWMKQAPTVTNQEIIDHIKQYGK